MSNSDGATSESDIDDEEWAFTLADLEEREEEAEKQVRAIEAGDPSLEGVVFLLLGVVFAIFVVSRLFV